MSTFTATPHNMVVAYHPGGPLHAGSTDNSAPGWYLHDGEHAIKVTVMKPFSNEELDGTPTRESYDGVNPLDPEGHFANHAQAFAHIGCLLAAGEIALERTNDNCVWLHPVDGRRGPFSLYAANHTAVIELYVIEQAKARGYDWPWEKQA